MSHGASSLAWHHSKAKGIDLLVLMAIANYINDDGAFPKVETLARDARTSPRQVHRSLNSLKELGEIDWVQKAGMGKGVYKSNLYYITLVCPPNCAGDWNHTSSQNVRSRGDMVSGLEVTATADKPVINPVKESDTRATRIPKDFKVSEEMKKWAAEHHPNVDLEKATLNFIDYWETKPKNNTKLDWVRTWQTWIRNTKEDIKRISNRVEENKSVLEKFKRDYGNH